MKNNLLHNNLIAYGIVILLCIALSVLHLTNDNWLSLATYLIFFITTLSLCKTTKYRILLSFLLIVVIGATVVLDTVAFSLTKEMPTAMRAMKMMTATTVIQNIVLSIYLFICTLLLWRENHLITRLIGWGICLYFATRLLPATWFTLQLIGSSV
ncbi:MAG: hypothetical protein KGV56_01995 [Gammaproteobacteria bacterium]|nr:hypothetical protein [Gammaproteobacteria bacterium]